MPVLPSPRVEKKSEKKRPSTVEEAAKREEVIDLELFRSTNRSGYRGVHWESEKYRAEIKVKNISRYLGSFDTVEEAAQAYARAYLRKHGGPPAPPAPSVADQFRQEEAGEEEIDLEAFRSEKSSSGYRGVSWDSSRQQYRTNFYVNGANKHLGMFNTVEEAARAYARANLREHGGPPAHTMNIPKTNVTLLKQELTNRGLPADGPKPALVERLTQAIQQEQALYLTMARQKAQPSGENDEAEQEASSLRPAKRARVATPEESGQASAASASGKEDDFRVRLPQLSPPPLL